MNFSLVLILGPATYIAAQYIIRERISVSGPMISNVVEPKTPGLEKISQSQLDVPLLNIKKLTLEEIKRLGHHQK